MANPHLSQIIAAAWEEQLRETPDPFNNPDLFGGPRLTYRERLDQQPINCFGQLIPRIVTVRRNIRQTKNYRDKW